LVTWCRGKSVVLFIVRHTQGYLMALVGLQQKANVVLLERNV